MPHNLTIIHLKIYGFTHKNSVADGSISTKTATLIFITLMSQGKIAIN